MGLLVRMGVYEDACTAEEIATAAASGAGLDQVKCAAQQAKIGSLLSVFRIAEFLTSMATGVFMDLIGTKICILTGMTLRILSWILLSNFPRINSLMIDPGMFTHGYESQRYCFPGIYHRALLARVPGHCYVCGISIPLRRLFLLLDTEPPVGSDAFCEHGCFYRR